MSGSKVPPVPTGIGARGRKFWKAAQADMEFDARETDLLIEVCRILDAIDALADAVAVNGVMLVGSQGQLVLNGAVAELRQQQQSYARLVAQLNLEGAEAGAVMKSPRAASASVTAKRRWSQRAGGF